MLNYKDKGSKDFSGYSSLCAFWRLEEEEEGAYYKKNPSDLETAL